MLPLLDRNKLPVYLRLTRADKPIGALLLLWPTLWALWIATAGEPSPWTLAAFVAGVWLMRAAGCVVSDYADRGFDGHVKRTACRPLPSGEATAGEARYLFAVLVSLSFLVVLTLNVATVLLSVVALALACAYPFAKRYTHLPQVVLGAAFGWSIPMASPPPGNPCRRSAGCCSSPISSGWSRTTRCTPRSTGTTT